MKFAVVKLSYNEPGDSQLEGGICGTGFFVDSEIAITAHHLCSPGEFQPNRGYRSCIFRGLTEQGDVFPIRKQMLEPHPGLDLTVINFGAPPLGGDFSPPSFSEPVEGASIQARGYKSDAMPVTAGRWDGTDFVIADHNLAPFREERTGTVENIKELRVDANDIQLSGAPGAVLSFGGRIGMSGGPLIDRESKDVLGMLSIGLPPDVPQKDVVIAISAEPLKQAAFSKQDGE